MDSVFRLSQRRYGATDWSQAWRNYLAFKENENFQRLGLGQNLNWDDEPEPETFVHVGGPPPPPSSMEDGKLSY